MTRFILNTDAYELAITVDRWHKWLVTNGQAGPRRCWVEP